MAKNMNISIRRGRTETIKVTITDTTGLPSWTDVNGLFVMKKSGGDNVLLSKQHDSIDEVNDIVVFEIAHDDTKDLTEDTYDYEVILYKDDLTLNQTSTYGECELKGVVQIDPTA